MLTNPPSFIDLATKTSNGTPACRQAGKNTPFLAKFKKGLKIGLSMV